MRAHHEFLAQVTQPPQQKQRMTTTQDTPTTEPAQPHWQAKIAEFRARAQTLFAAQRERVDFLEAAITEQITAANASNQANDAKDANGRDSASEMLASEAEQLRTQLAQCRKLLNARASELKQLRSLISEQADDVDGVDVATILEQASEMRLERDELIERLADAQCQVEQASSVDDAHFEDLQRRFETAVQEIRELKAKNDELQTQAARADSADSTTAPGGGFDWEKQKLRWMEQLDSDCDGEDATGKEAKLSIENTIRITDQVIAEKDRQIADLKALLEEQATVAAGEASVNALLDSDEQICAERERLGRLEDELREKLRVAEIDISVERAKLARERSEIDAKVRALEESGEKATGGKPAGRWLSRLGLNED